MSKISIQVTPSDDAGLASLSRQLLSALSDAIPEEKIVSGSDAPQRDGVVAILALVLAIPATIDTLLSIKQKLEAISERRKLKEEIEPTLENVKMVSSNGAVLIMHLGDRAINLGEVSVDDVLDALAEYESENRT